MDFLSRCLDLLMQLYQFIHAMRWGWAVSIVAGFLIAKQGEKMAGFRGYAVGKMRGGVFHAQSEVPGRQGSGGFFDGVVGTVLKLAGLVLVVMGIISGVNHLLSG